MLMASVLSSRLALNSVGTQVRGWLVCTRCCYPSRTFGRQLELPSIVEIVGFQELHVDLSVGSGEDSRHDELKVWHKLLFERLTHTRPGLQGVLHGGVVHPRVLAHDLRQHLQHCQASQPLSLEAG